MDSLPPVTAVTPLSFRRALLLYHREAPQCRSNLRGEKPGLQFEASASCDRGDSAALKGRTTCVFAMRLPRFPFAVLRALAHRNDTSFPVIARSEIPRFGFGTGSAISVGPMQIATHR